MISLIKLFASYHKFFTLFILIAITLLSLWPVSELPSVPGTDKTHHFIGYAALIFPSAFYGFIHFGNITKALLKYLVIHWVLFVLYSGLIELIQPYVNRYGEWLDLAANSVGLFFGIVIAGVIVKVLKLTS